MTPTTTTSASQHPPRRAVAVSGNPPPVIGGSSGKRGLELLRREPGGCGDARAAAIAPFPACDWRLHTKGRVFRGQCWYRIASVWCDLCPPGGLSCLRPSHSHGGLASAAARTTRDAEGKEGPDWRPGARRAPEDREGRGKGCGPDGHLQPSGDAADSASGVGGWAWSGFREPGQGGSGARPESDKGPGDPGHRPLWTPNPRSRRCAARPRTGVGDAGIPRGAPPEPLRTVSLTVI